MSEQLSTSIQLPESDIETLRVITRRLWGEGLTEEQIYWKIAEHYEDNNEELANQALQVAKIEYNELKKG